MSEEEEQEYDYDDEDNQFVVDEDLMADYQANKNGIQQYEEYDDDYKESIFYSLYIRHHTENDPNVR